MSNDNNSNIQVTVKTDDASQSLSFNHGEIVIGRGEECDIVVVDDMVSKKHLRIINDNGIVKIQDLGSSNGTFLNSGKIDNGQCVVRPGDLIQLGSIRTVIEISNIVSEIVQPTPSRDVHNKHVQKIEDKFKVESEKVDLNFKGVQIMQPLYQNPSKHAQEILAQAEILKKSIIKGAEVRADIIINEAQKQSNKIAQEKIDEYKKNIELLLQSARLEVEKMREEASLEVHQQKLKFENEQEQQRQDLENEQEEKRQQFDISLLREKNEVIKSETERLEEIYRQKISEKYKQIADEQQAEKQTYQNIINEYKNEIKNLEDKKAELLVFSQDFQLKNDEKLKQIDQLNSALGDLEKKNAEIEQLISEKLNRHNQAQAELDSLSSVIAEVRAEIDQIMQEKAFLKNQFDDLNKSFHLRNEELQQMLEKLEAEKASGFRLVTQEIKAKKDEEYQKFEEFKKQQAKEFQKISDEHLKSFQNLGPDISQSITQKLEIFYKKSDKFNYEKTFEIILSSVQSHFNYTGTKNLSDVKIEEKILEIKSAQRRKQVSMYLSSFVVYTILFFSAGYIKEKLNQDPLEMQRRELAAENQLAQEKNKYVFEQTDTYYDNYVQNTLNNKSFYSNYMNKENQQQWMAKATKYMLKKWKISEEKTIEVISGSKALVQTIEDARNDFTKTGFKKKYEKLVQLENDLIEKHGQRMGSAVRYEDYKRLEKDFFSKK